MSLDTFRSSFLEEADTRISGVNLSTATDVELLKVGAIYKMAKEVAGFHPGSFDLMNFLITSSFPDIDAWATKADSVATLIGWLSDPTLASQIYASTTAIKKIMLSTKCLEILLAYPSIGYDLAVAAENLSAADLTEFHNNKLAISLAYSNSGFFDRFMKSSILMDNAGRTITSAKFISDDATIFNKVTNDTNAFKTFLCTPQSVALALSSAHVGYIWNKVSAVAGLAESNQWTNLSKSSYYLTARLNIDNSLLAGIATIDVKGNDYVHADRIVINIYRGDTQNIQLLYLNNQVLWNVVDYTNSTSINTTYFGSHAGVGYLYFFPEVYNANAVVSYDSNEKAIKLGDDSYSFYMRNLTFTRLA